MAEPVTEMRVGAAYAQATAVDDETVVLDDDKPCICYLGWRDEQISGLNQTQLSNKVVMRNSNTGAYNLLKRCGHSPPPPTVAAEGWQFGLSW